MPNFLSPSFLMLSFYSFYEQNDDSDFIIIGSVFGFFDLEGIYENAKSFFFFEEKE